MWCLVHVVLALIFLSHIPLFAAQPCSPGKAPSPKTGQCQPCKRGTYQDGTVCTDCPPGTYNSFPGAQGLDLCRPCPVGTFRSKPGAGSLSACAPCPDSKSSPPASARCVRCKPGQFIKARKNKIPRCTRCPVATFTSEANMLECRKCPENLVAGVASSSCKRCPKGKEASLDNNRCRPCTGWQYNDGTLEFCEFCPSNLVANKRIGATRCVGSALRTTFDDSTSRCTTRCARGENSIKPRPLCVKDGTPCPSNHFEDSNGVCRACTVQQRYDSSMNECVRCPGGQLSRGNLDEECKPCPAGRVVERGQCVCPEGFYGALTGKCKICPPGSSWFRSSEGRGICLSCFRGTFSALPGSLECQPCPSDEVQPKDGQASCLKCPRGLIASNLFLGSVPSTANVDDPEINFEVQFHRVVARSVCVSPQTNCPPRMDRVIDKSGRFACEPRSCPPDTFEVKRSPVGFDKSIRICLNCPIGTFLSKKRRACVPCKFAEVSNGGMAAGCTPCPPNYHAVYLFDGTEKCVCENHLFRQEPKQVQLLDDGRCVRCPVGTTGSLGTANCTPCPPGTTEGFRKCFTCSAGTFTDKAGTKHFGPYVGNCEPCPNGTMTYGFGETSCIPIAGM